MAVLLPPKKIGPSFHEKMMEIREKEKAGEHKHCSSYSVAVEELEAKRLKNSENVSKLVKDLNNS